MVTCERRVFSEDSIQTYDSGLIVHLSTLQLAAGVPGDARGFQRSRSLARSPNCPAKARRVTVWIFVGWRTSRPPSSKTLPTRPSDEKIAHCQAADQSRKARSEELASCTAAHQHWHKTPGSQSSTTAWASGYTAQGFGSLWVRTSGPNNVMTPIFHAAFPGAAASGAGHEGLPDPA